jgi:hypothetical protein
MLDLKEWAVNPAHFPHIPSLEQLVNNLAAAAQIVHTNCEQAGLLPR